MVKKFINWLQQLEGKNSLVLPVFVFLFLFIAQILFQLVFNAELLFTQFGERIERFAFLSVGGALISLYFILRRKIKL
ncbi:MAG: hypothetical protein ABFS17_03455 [Chloroflexota bacterium]